MAWIKNVIWIQTFLSPLVLDVTSGLQCDCCKPPVKESAYNAAYSINFPEKGMPRQKCSWLISAYRDEHVLRLRFHDVNMTQAGNGSCLNQIVVYDGPTTRSPTLASFCGVNDVDLQTSSNEAQVVVILRPGSPLDTSVAKFQLKYNSQTSRDGEHQVAWILAFVGIVALLCCVAFCCGLLKCLVQWRSARISAQIRTQPAVAAQQQSRNIRNGRTGADDGDEEGDDDGDDDGDGGADDTENAAKKMSICDRFWNLLERLFHEKHWWNSPTVQRRHRTNCRAGPSNRGPRQQQQRRQRQQQPQQENQQQQQQQQQQHHHQTRRRQNYLPHQPRNDAVASLDFAPNDSCVTQTARDEFSFQDIPVSSFTSDPSEVKPPSYEDCLKNTNPLYLYHHGGGEDSLVFYNNRAPDHVDQAEPISAENANVSSPPPPYKEIDATDGATTRGIIDGGGGQPRQESNTNADSNPTALMYDRVPSFDERYTGNALSSILPPPPPFTEFADPSPLQSTVGEIVGSAQTKTDEVSRKTTKDESGWECGRRGDSTLDTLSSPFETHPTEHYNDTDTPTATHNTTAHYNDTDTPTATHIPTAHYNDTDTPTATHHDTQSANLSNELCDGKTKVCDAVLTSRSEREETASKMAKTTSTTVTTVVAPVSAAAAGAAGTSSVPYAMMRRSGLVTSLLDQQEVVNGSVTPVVKGDGVLYEHVDSLGLVG